MSLDKIKPYAKTVIAILGVLVTAVAQEFPDDPNVARWCSIASTVLTAVLVYAVPNRDPLGIRQQESTQPPSESYSGDSKTDATYHDGAPL